MNSSSLQPARTEVSGRRAFTLIELLVVISVVGILAGLALPIFSSVRASADKTTCVSHLKQIVAATLLKTNDNDGLYPNMHGYNWETTKTPPPGQEGDSTWMADVLAPYVSGIQGQDPTKLLRCPAAEKNQQESWLFDTRYCHYRYNYYNAQLTKPLVGFANAMLFFDSTYANWTSTQLAHSHGIGPLLNVAYADGHISTLNFADFLKLDPSDDGQNDFFTLGWTK